MAEPEMPRHVILRLSAQRALLGAVPASLRLVTATLVGTVVQVCFVFDGPIDEDDVESARLATTDIIADFPPPWTLEESFLRVDHPAPLQAFRWEDRVYERKELTTDGTALR